MCILNIYLLINQQHFLSLIYIKKLIFLRENCISIFTKCSCFWDKLNSLKSLNTLNELLEECNQLNKAISFIETNFNHKFDRKLYDSKFFEILRIHNILTNDIPVKEDDSLEKFINAEIKFSAIIIAFFILLLKSICRNSWSLLEIIGMFL